jgi:diguanylate cyclase (GGDEF)-like protein
MLTPPARRRNDAQPIDPPSVRVLLVDDDENFCAWLAHVLRRLGFVVESAVDGERALAMLHAAPYDLLISDYQMPRIDGFDLIRTVRADQALCNQYAVMLTSSEDIESKVAALTIGYDDFLPKSCTEVEVVAKVVAARRVVARQRRLTDAARNWEALATRDELTGVYTRRAIFEEARRHASESRSLGLAIIDLDGFKPINDTFGHLTGDRILRDVGALFLRVTREDDRIARYGGDEFLLMTVDRPPDDLTGAAARLIADIETLQWKSTEDVLRVSATFGAAHSSLLPEASLEQLLDAADRDLYTNKWSKKRATQAG